jgi:hypothetical protein
MYFFAAFNIKWLPSATFISSRVLRRAWNPAWNPAWVPRTWRRVIFTASRRVSRRTDLARVASGPHAVVARRQEGRAACVVVRLALERVLPDEGDYERMQGNESSAIVPGQDYDAWVRGQMEIVNGLNKEECAFVAAVCQHIIGGTLSHMDMESCSVFRTAGVFFNQAGELVTWNDR